MSIAEKFEIIADEVYEKGKKDECDKFWDVYQENGKRTNYMYAFYGWKDEVFYPKYDIKPTGNLASSFFLSTINNLKTRLEECGVVLDTANVSGLSSTFQGCYNLTVVPPLDVINCTSLTNVFYNDIKLIEAEFINLQSETTFANVFVACGELTDLRITGTIGQNGFNVKDCKKLTVDSLLSILTALSKDSNIASGKSITFSTVHQSVIEGNAECLEQLNLAVNAGWTIAYA